MPWRGTALAVMVAVIWGTNFVVIEAGLADMPPLLFLVIRFVVVLFPALLIVPRPAVGWRDLAVVGTLMSTAQFSLLYLGLNAGMPVGLASLVVQVQVLLTVLIARVVLRERPTRRQVAGVLLGAAGLAIVAVGRSAATPLDSLLLTVAAALCWAAGNVASRRLGVVSGLSMTVWSGVVVPLPLLLLSLLVEGPQRIGDALAHVPLSAIGSTLFTAYLSSLVGYGVWNSLLARHTAAAVAPFTLLIPAVGLITAWLVHGELPNPAEASGGVLLVLGVGISVLRRAPAERVRRSAP